MESCFVFVRTHQHDIASQGRAGLEIITAITCQLAPGATPKVALNFSFTQDYGDPRTTLTACQSESAEPSASLVSLVSSRFRSLSV